MKTIRTILFVAFAATIFISCQKELADNENTNSNGKLVTFTASVNSSTTDLKTAIRYEEGKATLTTYLTSQDGISVNGVKSESVTPNADNTAITFDVEGVTGPYYAVTSRHDKGYNAETKKYKVQFSGAGSPQMHSMTEKTEYPTFDTKADILAAYGESENLTFHHMSTFYAIKIDKASSAVDSKIKSIYVRQGDGGNIAGMWDLSFEGNEKSPKLSPNNLTAIIGYDCGAEGLDQGEVMLVGIPAYNYDNGLIFTIHDINGRFASFRLDGTKTKHEGDGGKIIPFPLSFNPETRRSIKDADDWNAFAEHMNATSGNPTQWIGGGTIVLEKDIVAETLTPITAEFKYTLDGNGKTITQTNATNPLFSKLSGEIKDLTLNGNLTLSSSGAPFVHELYAGGKISNCTNNMDVTFSFTDATTYVAAFAAVLPTIKIEGEYVTTLTDCVNNGDLIGETNYTPGYVNPDDADDKAPFNVAIGGIVGDVRAGGTESSGAVAYKVILTDCDNNGVIKFTPKPDYNPATSAGSLKATMGLTGIGGVVGTFRNSKSIEMDDCDNTGNITLSAEGMTHTSGMRPYAIALGGVIGCGAFQSGMNITLTGHDIILKNCDNSGLLYNCGDNYSASTRGGNKVYTGGLAGALIGLENKFASLQSCSNTGSVITYDLCSDDNPVPSVVSVRPAYNAVAGGLIGFGGWLDMDRCTVSCQIGNGKRQMVAWGGVIGYTVRKFRLNDATLHLRGYFQRIDTYKMNRAVVAVVPKATADDGLTPDISDSVISGTLTVSSSMKSLGSLADKSTITNLSSTLTLTMFNSDSKAKSNLVHGQGMSSANTGVDITNLTITYSAN